MVKYFDEYRVNDFFDVHDAACIEPDDAKFFFNNRDKVDA